MVNTLQILDQPAVVEPPDIDQPANTMDAYMGEIQQDPPAASGHMSPRHENKLMAARGQEPREGAGHSLTHTASGAKR